MSKGRNDFTIVTTDPETARESEPLQVIATVPVLDIATGAGIDPPTLPEGVDATNLSGTPSAELMLTAPRKGFKSNTGKVKVDGTSDAESVVVSFQWRGHPERRADRAGTARAGGRRTASSAATCSCPRGAGRSPSRLPSMAGRRP